MLLAANINTLYRSGRVVVLLLLHGWDCNNFNTPNIYLYTRCTSGFVL